MSHFYATAQGNHKQATRTGTKDSGLTTTAASWQGAVRVNLYEHDGVDWTDVELIPWHGQGITHLLYNGPVSGKDLTDS